MHQSERTQGYVLVTALMAMVLLILMVTIYQLTSLNSPRTVRSQADSLGGFMAAEGGLNMRAAVIRDKFVGFERPSGVACPQGAASGGSGDFVCTPYPLGGRNVLTGVRETTVKPEGDIGTVAEGEQFAGLFYSQYSYRVTSEAQAQVQGQTVRQANLEMEFQSRLVPLFQFAAFYANDLEINPGPTMTLNGRVHTNADLFLAPDNRLNIGGQVSAQGEIYRKRKDNGSCNGNGTVQFKSGSPLGCTGGAALTQTQLALYGKQVGRKQPKLEVPPMSSLSPDLSGKNELWEKADLRIVALRCGVTYCVQAQNSRGVVDVSATVALNSPLCAGATSFNSSFYDARERRIMTLLNVNQQRLMDCIENSPSGTFRDNANQPVKVNNASQGGLVIHLSFSPPQNNLGVRLQNAATLGTTSGVKPVGLTVATNQPIYLQGNYNVNGKVPASILADAINVLSDAWVDTNKTSATTSLSAAVFKALPTTINAAFLSGTVPTVGSAYSGGLENYPRLHERWTDVPLTYSGSFVSLGTSVYATARWTGAGSNFYEAPVRNWSFDESFRNAAGLPPLTPRFVYLRQLFLSRDFD